MTSLKKSYEKTLNVAYEYKAVVLTFAICLLMIVICSLVVNKISNLLFSFLILNNMKSSRS